MCVRVWLWLCVCVGGGGGLWLCVCAWALVCFAEQWDMKLTYQRVRAIGKGNPE